MFSVTVTEILFLVSKFFVRSPFGYMNWNFFPVHKSPQCIDHLARAIDKSVSRWAIFAPAGFWLRTAILDVAGTSKRSSNVENRAGACESYPRVVCMFRILVRETYYRVVYEELRCNFVFGMQTMKRVRRLLLPREQPRIARAATPTFNYVHGSALWFTLLLLPLAADRRRFCIADGHKCDSLGFHLNF